MNCTHKTKVAYELTEVDKADFGQRLEDFLGSDNYEKLAMNFLTPTNSLRGHRARSMLTTTVTTVGREGTSVSKLLDTENEEFNSGEKRRSSVRRPRRNFLAPSKFFNCAECGAIYFHVSFMILISYKIY